MVNVEHELEHKYDYGYEYDEYDWNNYDGCEDCYDDDSDLS